MQIGSREGVLVAGTATKNAEFKTIGDNNTPLAIFSLAINKRNDEGKFVECKAFGKLADYARWIKKGDPVAAAGFVESREYNGKTYNDLVCQWVSVSVTGTPQQSGGSDYPEYEDIDNYDDGDLPF